MNETGVLLQEPPISIKTVATGSNSKVRLIKDSKIPEKDALPVKKGGLLSKIPFFSQANATAIEISTFTLQTLPGYILRGEINEEFINVLRHASPEELALAMTTFSSRYYESKFNKEKMERRSLPEEEGLMVADFLEVLPRSVAARIVLACANPNIAREIQTSTPGKGYDSQQIAIEGIMVSSSKLRREIFREMMRISPGEGGAAYQFYKLLVSNWPNRQSDFNGQRFLERNFLPATANDKIREFNEELADLGQFLRSRP